MEQSEDCLDYNKNGKKLLLEKALSKWSEAYLATMLEGVKHEMSLIYLISLTNLGILKQSDFTEDEINMVKSFALEKLFRQRILKEYVAVSFIE